MKPSALAVALVCALDVAACGGGVHQQVVARVGSTPITKAELQSAMREVAPEHVVPNPPHYSSCIAHAKSLAIVDIEEADAKRECEQQYGTLLSKALGSLVVAHWLIGEARAHGLLGEASESERLAAETSQAQAALYRLATRRTAVSAAQVARYYARHLRDYSHRERRTILIAENFATAASAAKAKRGVEHGADLRPISLRETVERFNIYGGRYTTKQAQTAIFTATPNVLSGPIKLNRYYSIFKVIRILPPERKPLATVAPSIRTQLEEAARRRSLAAFVKAWRDRWIAQTSCVNGYVITKCREYRGRRVGENPQAFG